LRIEASIPKEVFMSAHILAAWFFSSRSLAYFHAAARLRSRAHWRFTPGRRLATILLLVVLGEACASRVFGAVSTAVVTDTEGISGFDFYNNGLIWWDTPGRCSGEFPNDGTIRVRITSPTGSTKNLARSCSIMQAESDTPVADGSYVYFFSNSQLQRKALNALEGSASTPFPTPPFSPTLPAAQRGAFLELADGALWFGRYNGVSGSLDLFRIPTDGSGNAESIASISGANAAIRKMQWFQYRDARGGTLTALAVMLENGRLYRVRITGTATLLATGVIDFAIHTRFTLSDSTTSIYAAKGAYTPSPSSPASTLVRILADTGDTTTVYTAQGDNQVLSVATDSSSIAFGPTRYIYITEGIIVCNLLCGVTDFVIRRNSTPGTDGTWDLILASAGGTALRSDNQYLYFTRLNSIRRLPTDAPPIEFNIAAEGLEVVQFMQNLSADQALIANKEGTMARGYARVVANTTGNSTFSPTAQLRVFVGGSEVSGSPFAPINNASISANSTVTFARSNVINSFLFALPPLPPGSLTATMTVNHNQTMVETGLNPYNNNSVSLPKAVTVAPSSVPCLVLVPMPTIVGSFNASDPTVPAIIRRAETQLPVQEFDLRSWSALTDDHDIVTESLFFLFPFGGVNSDDEQDDAAIDAVECLMESSSYPSGCDAAHWIGMIHPALATNFIGYGGGLGNRPGRALIASMRSDGNGSQAPRGGSTLAHELGHNYNRRHVPCACGATTPKNPDILYPPPWCSILPLSAGTDFAFDPISQTALDPNTTGDLMSYACTRWPSRYTWNGVYPAMFFTTIVPGITAVALSKFLPPEHVLFVSGVLKTNQQSVKFTSFYQLPAAQVDPHNLSNALAASEVEATNVDHFAIRLINGNGALLGETALPVSETSDGTPDRFSFVHFVPFDPQARRVQLVRGATVYGERIVTAHSPTLQIGAPVVDPVAQTVKLNWTAGDADGDTIYFFIHYSPDNGVHWNAYSLNYRSSSITLDTRRWPASVQGRLRVTVSDGVNTTFAITDPFVIPNHGPEIMIGGVAEGERVPFGEARELVIAAIDAEDGRAGVNVSWTLTGPSARSGINNCIPLQELTPGLYRAAVTAIDRANQQTTVARHFEISPLLIPDRAAPVLDGACADLGYTTAAFFRLPQGDGTFVPVRMLHSEDYLFVAFTDLSYGARGNRSIGLRVDVNNNRTAGTEASDLGFFVDEDGIPFQETGSVTGMVVTLSPKVGFTAVVQRGSNGWCAEFRIADTLLGGWNHPVGLMVDHGTPAWPANADDDSAMTWAPAFLGVAPPAPANRAPIANAGDDLVVNVSGPRRVVLDGLGSRDPDGDPLAFQWTQVSGPSVTLSNSSSAQPSFLVLPPLVSTTMVFRLVVNDGTNNSLPDDVQVNATAVQRLPLVSTPGAILSDGAFFGQLRATPGERHIVQGTFHFDTWLPIETNTVDFLGLLQFIDKDRTNFPYRFYRSIRE
jgi:hypothetical protein